MDRLSKDEYYKQTADWMEQVDFSLSTVVHRSPALSVSSRSCQSVRAGQYGILLQPSTINTLNRSTVKIIDSVQIQTKILTWSNEDLSFTYT